MLPSDESSSSTGLVPALLSTLQPSADLEDDVDERFDAAVALLDQLVQDDDFVELQEAFFLDNCELFTFDEENKLVYTELHTAYMNLVEQHVVSRLEAEVPGFQLEEFLQLLEERHGEVSPEAIDTLTRATDFLFFKQAMLTAKLQEEELDRELEQSLRRFYLSRESAATHETFGEAVGQSPQSSESGTPRNVPLAPQSMPPLPADRPLVVGPRNLRRLISNTHLESSESG